MQKFRQLLLPTTSGVLMAWPWLDERAFAAAWAGLVLMMAVAVDQPPHIAFRRCLLAGMTGLGIAFHWFPQVASSNLRISYFGGLTTATLGITWDAFRFGVFGWVAAKINSRVGTRIFVWPVVWVALEWGWPHIFPWRLGTSQLGWLPVCQIAEFTGVYGVSFLMIWVAAVVTVRLPQFPQAVPLPAERSNRRLSLTRSEVICGLIFTTVIAWGDWRIGNVEAMAAGSSTLKVALIQPGSPDINHLRRASKAVSDSVDLVVWPESCADDFSLALSSFRSLEEVREHSVYADDSRPCHGLGNALLCGGGSFPEGAMNDGPFFNTAFLVDANEEIVDRYHKRFLMPWGEYVVGQQWIPGVRSLLGDSNNQPGSSAAPLSCPGGPELGVLICYEDLLAEPVRQTTAEGAEVLLNLNNLSIFGKTPALYQHQQIARFRAIEHRRVLLRCGVVGSTAVICPTGRVTQQAPFHTTQTVISAAPLFTGLTFYVRWGDVFAYTCIVMTAVMCVNRSWRGGEE
ncbi:apolipoprotein N-acyltransferase [Fuerstiella marisgermanici]|uniref:Apolipoprotein N-acyltransferase n=1 Tax=Fuerstiella marisgermanici TaxID=1891926 RepID=A0A1P8WQA1_9PLAN|nr:apolipoprotein N-acyltransferase [Fuerstiella marisgermanici]APZ96241.1 Apolipoprotein N-acyltransferase [Fuerstiella marisgermanici]